MGFACQGLWVMGYCGLMGYGLQIPTHQLGGTKWAWYFRGYGLLGAWVKRVSTVSLKIHQQHQKRSLFTTPAMLQKNSSCWSIIAWISKSKNILMPQLDSEQLEQNGRGCYTIFKRTLLVQLEFPSFSEHSWVHQSEIEMSDGADSCSPHEQPMRVKLICILTAFESMQPQIHHLSNTIELSCEMFYNTVHNEWLISM